MKWQSSLLVLLLTTSVFVACSDSGNDDPTPSTQAANTTTVAPAQTTVTSNAKEKRSDAAAKKIKGKVQTMTETVYAGENIKQFSVRNVFKYDENGNQVELVNYKSNGKLNSTIKSTYDAAGRIMSEETLLADGTVDIKSFIKSDDKGNRVEQSDIKQDGKANELFNFKYTYKYDEKGRVIERSGVRGNGSFFLKYNFTYDVNGNITEWIQVSQTGTIAGKTDYRYDDKNNIIEETKYNADGSVKETFTYTYELDKKANWTKQKKMKDGAVVEVRTREYKYY